MGRRKHVSLGGIVDYGVAGTVVDHKEAVDGHTDEFVRQWISLQMNRPQYLPGEQVSPNHQNSYNPGLQMQQSMKKASILPCSRC